MRTCTLLFLLVMTVLAWGAEPYAVTPYLTDTAVESRSISFENPTAEKGKGQ